MSFGVRWCNIRRTPQIGTEVFGRNVQPTCAWSVGCIIAQRLTNNGANKLIFVCNLCLYLPYIGNSADKHIAVSRVVQSYFAANIGVYECVNCKLRIANARLRNKKQRNFAVRVINTAKRFSFVNAAV